MATGIKGQFPVTFRVAFELHYRFGFTYLDRCGRTINLIQRTLPEWIFPNQQPNPQNTPLVSSENSCRFSFSSQQLDMGITKPIGEMAIGEADLARFAEQVEQITSIVTDQLSLDDFSRIGARI